MMRDVSNTRYRETVHACKCGFRLVVWPDLMLGLGFFSKSKAARQYDRNESVIMAREKIGRQSAWLGGASKK